MIEYTDEKHAQAIAYAKENPHQWKGHDGVLHEVTALHRENKHVWTRIRCSSFGMIETSLFSLVQDQAVTCLWCVADEQRTPT